MEIYTTLSPYMVFLEWGGTGLLFIAHKVKFVTWAYDYQVGSDWVCLSQTRCWHWPPEGLICHSDLFWSIEKKSRYDTHLFWLNFKEENFLIKRITTLGVKGWLVLQLAKHFCHTTAEIHQSAVELVHRDLQF